MAPPRKHETDAILDATRTLVLSSGARAASVTAIAEASGAPAGTLYHRFGNRNGILAAAWLRSLERFQSRAMAAQGGTPLDTVVAVATAFVGFARDLPEDAQLLLTLRPSDLLDGEVDAAFQDRLTEMNAPLIERVREVARQLFGKADERSVEAVTRAVVDLPYGVVRRHAFDRPMPRWLEADVAAAARAIVVDHGSRKGRKSAR